MIQSGPALRRRRADIFIARANGARWVDLARAWGISVERVRQLDRVIEWRCFAEADRRFNRRPTQWICFATPTCRCTGEPSKDVCECTLRARHCWRCGAPMREIDAETGRWVYRREFSV